MSKIAKQLVGEASAGSPDNPDAPAVVIQYYRGDIIDVVGPMKHVEAVEFANDMSSGDGGVGNEYEVHLCTPPDEFVPPSPVPEPA